MDEVSYRALGPLANAYLSRGLPLDDLTAGLPLLSSRLRNGRGRAPWDAVAEAFRRAGERLGGLDELEEATYENAASPQLAQIFRVASTLARPRDLYWLGAMWFGRSVLPMVEVEFRDIAPNYVEQRLRIPKPYRESLEFFHAMRGYLRAAPKMMELEEAPIEMWATPRVAVYQIRLPYSLSLGRRLAALVGTRRSMTRMIEAMGAQQDELLESYQNLRSVNEDLEQRVDERTRELLASRARLEESQRLASLGTLAAGIAHEINNPLASIQATAQLELHIGARNAGGAEAHADDPLTKIISESKRCARIVRGLLQFARDEPTEKWEIDANEVIERACQLVSHLAEERRVEVRRKDKEGPLDIHANPIQIEQVLINVLRNAIQASEAGAVVDLHGARVGDRIQLTVEDRGCGMPESTLLRIFEPFFTTRLDQGGSGLGLSMAHGITREHGGHIEARSEPGVGTSVLIELPARTQSAARREVAERGQGTSDSAR